MIMNNETLVIINEEKETSDNNINKIKLNKCYENLVFSLFVLSSFFLLIFTIITDFIQIYIAHKTLLQSDHIYRLIIALIILDIIIIMLGICGDYNFRIIAIIFHYLTWIGRIITFVKIWDIIHSHDKPIMYNDLNLSKQMYKFTMIVTLIVGANILFSSIYYYIIKKYIFINKN